MPNNLINETSPYLLQHAHNPVNWYPWGEEALNRSIAEDKPILVSIGYAACHWCHVMEKESFEDDATAELMNDRFINIKIDREERPDLDHIYMEAVQAISGSGGWPLNVFLTPDKKPFYGGTYFPPQPVHNRASWKDVLTGVSDAFKNRRKEIDSQAESLMNHLEASNNFGIQASGVPSGKIFSGDELKEMCENVLKTADPVHGGFGRAPKFPQTITIRFLLHHYFYTNNEKALQQACISLDKMIDGGIHDHLGGGFARYSTDEIWLAPHFEKMLYDNAFLVTVISEAYQLTSNSKYLDAITSTLDFVERELMSPEGGFYSALDADSEGVEGKYYVWTRREIESILGEDAALFNKYYNITDKGNWEHTNILHVTLPAEEFARNNNIELDQLKKLLERSKQKLLLERSKRIRPMTDDKILLGWNAMMNTAYCKAFAATGNEKYRMLAVKNMEFLTEKFSKGTSGEFYHTYKNEARYPAFLDDYSQLIHSLIHLQEITSDTSYLEKVKTLVKWCIDHFNEPETSYFYFTNDQQQDVVIRKKELYDGAVPSGNSIMAWNFYYSGVVFDNADWRERAVSMCSGIKEVVQKYPGSFGIWAIVMQALSKGVPEIAIVGGNLDTVLKEILRIFIPFRIIQSSPSETKEYPLLAGKPSSLMPKIYLCKDYSCQTPVNEVSVFRKMLIGMFKE
jgi:uncharacterized protein YyaL (SSP411 family)